MAVACHRRRNRAHACRRDHGLWAPPLRRLRERQLVHTDVRELHWVMPRERLEDQSIDTGSKGACSRLLLARVYRLSPRYSRLNHWARARNLGVGWRITTDGMDVVRCL